VKESGRLFAEQGFAVTTIVQIEEAVGLSPGSGALYRHFASKQDILYAVFAETQARIEASRSAADLMVGAPVITPDDEALMSQLLMAYKLVITSAEATRDLAMIYFKDGASLGDDISMAMQRSTAEAFERTARHMGARRTLSKAKPVEKSSQPAKPSTNSPTKTKPSSMEIDVEKDVEIEVEIDVEIDHDVDDMAEAFLFLTPILYAKLIDWMNGSPPAGLTHERIAKAWAKQQVRLRGERGDRSGLTS
jgi:AcrR family transcriptional regulator